MILRIFLKIAVLFLILNSDFLNLNCYNQTEKLILIRDELNSNYYSFDIRKLKDLLTQSEALSKSSSAEWYSFYYSGLLCYQLGKIYYLIDKETAFNYFDKSVDWFKQAKSLSNSTEIIILLSASYGKLSSLSTLSAIYYGIKSKSYIEDAYKIEPDNPKLLLVGATHLMHTPETFGGSKVKARQFLMKALALNKSRKEKDSMLVKWAEDAEIYAYLGQLEILLKNKSKALYFMDKALKLVPDYGFVKKDLNIQLEKIK
jgi:tetratricopeptide (TPR) repeat protein